MPHAAGPTSGSAVGVITTGRRSRRCVRTAHSGNSIRSASPRPVTSRVFEEKESAQCEFGAPLVDGDRAAVMWNAQTRLVGGGTEDLIGVSLHRFDTDGLVIEQRDIWVGR